MGLPFAGKSFAILQLADAIANPRTHNWLGFTVYGHGPVVISQFDTPRLLWTNRIRGLQSELDFSHVWWSDRLDAPKPFDITRPAHYDWYREQIISLPEEPVAVIFDVIRELHRGDENSQDQMQSVIDGLVRAIEPASLVVVSHTRKPDNKRPRSESDPDMNEQRGAVYVNGRVDTVIKLTGSGLYMESRTAPKLHVPLHQVRNGCWRPSGPAVHDGQPITPTPSQEDPL
jgi:RecA-family ATPase